MALEGVMMTQGFGFLQYDRKTGKMGGMIPSLMNLFSNNGELDKSTSRFVDLFSKNAGVFNAERIDKLAASIGGVDKAVVDSAKGFSQSGQSIAQWRTQVAGASTAGQALKGVLMSIGGIVGSMAIAWGISELIEGVNAILSAQDHMISAAKGYQDAIKGISTSMDSYKSQVSSLSETLKSDDATTEQKVQARKDLISLQQKLIEEYGKEPGAISDINSIINAASKTMNTYGGAIDKTSEAWNRLAKTAMDASKRSSDAQDSWWEKVANKVLYGTESTVDASLEQYKKFNNEIRPAGFFNTNIGQSKELVKYIESIGGIKSPNGWSFEGSATEVLEKYEQIYAKAVALGDVNESWVNDLRSQIDDVKNLIDNTSEYRNFYAEDLINYTEEYSKARDSINTLYEEYNNAIAENELDLASNLKEQIVSQLAEVEEITAKDPDVRDWFGDTFSEFQPDIDLGDFANYLNEEVVEAIKIKKGNATQNVRRSYEEIFDEALSGIKFDERFGSRAANLEELQRMASLLDAKELSTDKGYTQNQIDAFMELNVRAAEAGYSIQEVLTMLNQLGKVDTRNLQDAMDKFIPRNASDEYKQKMEGYLRDLEDNGQLESVLTLDVEISKANADKTIDRINAELDAQLEQKKAYEIDFDMAGFLHGLEAVQTALTTTDGLTDDTIADLKSYFSALDDFNPAKLFEETTKGIQVNHKELARLVQEMESVRYDEIVQQEKQVIETYDSLMEAMSHMNKASPEYAQAQIDLDNLREQSKLVGNLISKYDEATSAYKKFLNAQSTPDQSEGYVTIASKYDEMKKLAEANRWGNDDLKTYLNLFSYEDTSTDGIEKQQELWKSLKETIEGTNKTKMDFFKLDSEGNVTIQGAANLADAINQKFGDAYATLKDGMWTLDLTGGKFEEVAKGLNISESALDLILDSLGEFGYNVQRSVDLAVDAVTRLGVTTEEAKQKFKDLGFDFDFDINEASISELNGYIQTLEIFANKNRDESGAFKMDTDGMQEAVVLLDELIRKRQELEDKNMAVMNIDTSNMDLGLQRTIELIQKIRTASEQIELGKANGALDIDIQQYRTEIINALSELSKEDLSQYVEKFDLSELFEINQGNVDSKLGELKEKISSITNEQINGDITVEATADTDSITSDVDAAVSENDGKEITVGTTVDESAVETFKAKVESTEVNLPVKPTLNEGDLSAIRGKISSQSVSIPVKINPIGGTIGGGTASTRRGSAGAYGGAFAGGRALVGELGRELVVDPHNGRYQTVGDHGAEFVNLPKDAIVFNHWQTKRLFQGNNPGRGTAFAAGNAYAGGEVSIYSKDRAVGFLISPDYNNKAIKKAQKDLLKTAEVAKDAFDDALSPIEENEDVMSKLSGELDDIQSAWKSLDEIMQDYAETGKITVDQAQEIANMDLRYLSMLNLETEALGVNEAGFESLTQAKIYEMQITMMRNAIDLIGTFTDESVAAQYLANSYLQMGDAALTAAGMVQQLQAAVAGMQGSLGANGQAAAQMAMQGAINGITMLNNVDTSAAGAGVKSGGGGGGGGGGEEEKEPTEEKDEGKEYEKDFDWIEKLLERLNKMTKRWTDQADRFFSFWNQNWALNKAIKSGREEIENTKKAISYYMTKAGEVELDPEYVKLIQKGALNVETIEDEDLGDQIDEYQEWWDKIEKCRDSLQELYDTERDMIMQKLDNILDYYGKIQDYYDSLIGKFEAATSMREASGQRTQFKDLVEKYAADLESLDQIKEKQWAYQTGLTGYSERSSSEVYADLQKTLGSQALDNTTEFIESKYGEFYKDLIENNIDAIVSGVQAADSNAYANALKRRKELEKQIAAYDLAVETKNKLKNEDIKEAKANKDKDEQNRIKKLIAEQDALIKQYKLTSKDKKSIKQLDNELEAWEAILSQSDDFTKAATQLGLYQARLREYESFLEQKQNKENWKSLSKEDQKTINQAIKETKLSSKEKKEYEYLQSLVDAYDLSGDYTKNSIYAENYAKLKDLEYRKKNNENLNYAKKVTYENIDNEYRLDVIKGYKNDIKALNKELKQAENKYTNKDENLRRWIVQQQEELEKLNENNIVDTLTSQSANYKELLTQIGAIQSKTKIKPADEKKLAMYLSELNEINAGVMEEDIVKFRNQYEKWWQLNDKLLEKGSLSVDENRSKVNLEASMASMQQKYQDYVKSLQDELIDSLMIEDPKNKEDLTQNYERTKAALEESYESQLKASKEAYMNTARYRDLYASFLTKQQTIDKLTKQIETAKANGKNTSNLQKKLDKAIQARDKLQDELDALAKGATEENIANYIEAWEYVRKNEDAYVNGRLNKSAADTYDKYRKQLEDWDKEKENSYKAIQQEMTDKLKELETTYNKNLNEIETEQYEKLEEMWELAKQIAEWEATSLQSTIDQLDAMINRYQAIADMFSHTSFESLKKYNVMDLLGLDKAKSQIELVRDQLEKGISTSKNKISSLVDMAGVYKELLSAAQVEKEDDPNHFQSILEKYYNAESTTDEMRKTLDSIIQMLNDNNYTANDWITDWNDKLQEAINSVIEAVDNIQNLKDQLRENVIFKAANQAIEQLDSLNSRLSSMAGVIHDNWVIVGDTLTEFGLTKINLLGRQMQNAQKQVSAWAEKVKAIDEIQSDEEQIAAYGSTEEYLLARNNALENYYNSLQNVESLAYEIYSLGKQADEARVNSLRNVAENFRSALDAKKSYYEYDKNIKTQTKDIEALKAQIEALNGVKVRPFYFNCGKILRVLTTKYI